SLSLFNHYDKLYQFTIVNNEEEAIERLLNSEFDIGVMSFNLSEMAERKMEKIIAATNDPVILAKQRDNESWDHAVDRCINQYQESNRKVYHFTDNAFEHARIHIHVQP